MSMQTQMLTEALSFILQPENLLLIFSITIIGIILGAMPGVGQALALALMFPFTFTMRPNAALMVMAVLYGASTFGGSIAAILIRVPGTPTSMATVLDGYPMSRSGQSAVAIGLSAFSSFVGAIVGLVILIWAAPALAQFSLRLGEAELFMLTLVGFSTVSAVTQGSLMKSLASVSLGVLFATVGVDPTMGEARFTFETYYLQGGINLIVLLVGLFSIPQALNLVNMDTISETGEVQGNVWDGIKKAATKPLHLLRGSVIGTIIGSIPGVGATSANFISYLTAINSSNHPETFGDGEPEGVIAAESANNGSAIGSLVPAMALAIPGSATAAIFIGVMIAHGITPGPAAFEGSLPYIIYISILLGSIMFFIIGAFGAQYFVRVTTLPTDIILVGIITFSLIGSFAVRSNILDVMLAITVGLLGYVMERQNYSIVAFVLAFILTPIAETGFQRSMIISDGDWGIFVSTRISIILLFISVIVLFLPIISRLYRR